MRVKTKDITELTLSNYSKRWHKDFIDNCVMDLKVKGKCYCYFFDDIKEIQNEIKKPITISNDDGTYTLMIPDEYRERSWVTIAKFVHKTCGKSYTQIMREYDISFSYYTKVNSYKKTPTDIFINKLIRMINDLKYEINGNYLEYGGERLFITNQEVERIELTRTQKST